VPERGAPTTKTGWPVSLTLIMDPVLIGCKLVGAPAHWCVLLPLHEGKRKTSRDRALDQIKGLAIGVSLEGVHP
jgi:hypothetical protein